MRKAAIALAFVLIASPAFAQIGSITKRIGQAQDAKNKMDKLAGMSEKEERQLGERISALLVDRFGVHQDEAVAKYVALVGSVLAQASTRPGLAWEFIVLDTDAVNAYAAPGGFVHITRGALGLIKNEAELAGVLGHEVIHITEKHTVASIDKANRVDVGTDVGTGFVPGGGWTQEALNRFADIGYRVAFENKYDRNDEMESDKLGIQAANKIGYAPTGLASFLKKIAERNKGMKEPNGWFASHPLLQDRIEEMEKTIKKEKLNATATVQTRYAEKITFDATPVTAVAMNIVGVRGAVGDTPAPKEEAKKEEKKGGGLSGIAKFGGSKSQNSQTVASAGSRGVGAPDRDAIGGPNKSKVKVSISPAEIEAFKKGIAA
jgi:beta-barrel assembly-enhancing protease